MNHHFTLLQHRESCPSTALLYYGTFFLCCLCIISIFYFEVCDLCLWRQLVTQAKHFLAMFYVDTPCYLLMFFLPLDLLCWQVLDLYFCSTGKNKDEPRKRFSQWPADVISELKEETHVWVYLRQSGIVNRNCCCDGCFCVTHVSSVKLFSALPILSERMSCVIPHAGQLFEGHFWQTLPKGKGSLKSFLADSCSTSNRTFSFVSWASSLVWRFERLTRQRCSSLCLMLLRNVSALSWQPPI